MLVLQVQPVPSYYLRQHQLLLNEFQNSTHWPKHLLVRYHWSHSNALNVNAALYILFGLGKPSFSPHSAHIQPSFSPHSALIQPSFSPHSAPLLDSQTKAVGLHAVAIGSSSAAVQPILQALPLSPWKSLLQGLQSAQSSLTP